MSGAVHSLPQYASMAWCLVKKKKKSTGKTSPLEQIIIPAQKYNNKKYRQND
jgi:hypothetical protein